MAKEPLPESFKAAVLSLKEAFPAWTQDRIAESLGISSSSVARILQAARGGQTRKQRRDIGKTLYKRMLRDLVDRHGIECREAQKSYKEHWSVLQTRQAKELEELRASFVIV